MRSQVSNHHPWKKKKKCKMGENGVMKVTYCWDGPCSEERNNLGRWQFGNKRDLGFGAREDERRKVLSHLLIVPTAYFTLLYSLSLCSLFLSTHVVGVEFLLLHAHPFISFISISFSLSLSQATLIVSLPSHLFLWTQREICELWAKKKVVKDEQQ